MVDLKLMLEITKRFRTKIRSLSVKKQRNMYKGQLASHLAKKLNPALDARKSMYRRMYLMMKQREQQMYGSKARSLSMRK